MIVDIDSLKCAGWMEVLAYVPEDQLEKAVMKLTEGILSKKRLRERIIEHKMRAQERLKQEDNPC